jgi:hypothetical protein
MCNLSFAPNTRVEASAVMPLAIRKLRRLIMSNLRYREKVRCNGRMGFPEAGDPAGGRHRDCQNDGASKRSFHRAKL